MTPDPTSLLYLHNLFTAATVKYERLDPFSLEICVESESRFPIEARRLWCQRVRNRAVSGFMFTTVLGTGGTLFRLDIFSCVTCGKSMDKRSYGSFRDFGVINSVLGSSI